MDPDLGALNQGDIDAPVDAEDVKAEEPENDEQNPLVRYLLYFL
jgi:hypothetical protein